MAEDVGVNRMIVAFRTRTPSRERAHNANEIMAEIVAKRLVEIWSGRVSWS